MNFLWKQRHRSSDLVGTVINIHTGDWIRRGNIRFSLRLFNVDAREYIYADVIDSLIKYGNRCLYILNVNE